MPSLIRDRHPADTRLSLDLPLIVPLDHAVAHMATAKEFHDFAVVVSLLAGSTALDTSTPAVRVPVAPGRRAQYHFLVPNLVRRWVVLSPPGE